MIRQTRVIPFPFPLLFLPARLKEWRHLELKQRYEAQGGNFAFLCFLAAQASPERSPLARNKRAYLTRLEEDLQRYLHEPDLDPELKRYTVRTLFAVSIALRASPVPQGSPLNRTRNAGRPRGTTRPTLVAATLAYEFRRRFRGPCDRSVLALLQKVVPKVFAEGDDPISPLKALQDRIAHAPIDEVEQFHADVTRAWSA